MVDLSRMVFGRHDGVTAFPAATPEGTGPLQPEDFTYLGAFRTFEYTGYCGLGLCYYKNGDSGRGSLLMSRQMFTDFYNTWFEIEIVEPQISGAATPHSLPLADTIGTPFDHTGGVLPAYYNVDPPNRKCQSVSARVVDFGGGDYKLFSVFGHWYAEDITFPASIQYCDITGSRGTLSVTNPRGPWRFDGYYPARYSRQIWEVPQAWADVHTGGRRIACGNMGFGVQTANAGSGHSAWFFDPRVDDPMSASPPTGNISYVVGPEYNGGEDPFPDNKLIFPTVFETWGWKPPADSDHPLGYNFSWGSVEGNSGMQWITTSDGRSGLVGVVATGCGWETYANNPPMAVQISHPEYSSQPWPRQGPDGTVCYSTWCWSQSKGPLAEYYRPALLLYDPDDYAWAIQNPSLRHTVKAYNAVNLWTEWSLDGWRDFYRDSSGTIRRWSDDTALGTTGNRSTWNASGGWIAASTAWDPDHRLLYICQMGAYYLEPGGTDPMPLIHVYQVA